MTIEEFKNKCDSVVYEYMSNPYVLNLGEYDLSQWLFSHIFNTRLYSMYLSGNAKWQIEYLEELKLVDNIKNINSKYPLYIEEGCDVKETVKVITKEYISEGFFLFPDIFITQEFFLNTDGYVFFTKPEISDRFKNCIVKYNKKDKYFGYISCGRNGFRTTKMEIKELCTNDNFLDNYNEDLPWDKMCEFVTGEYSGLMLAFGTMGSGKTSLIRHLIATHDDVNFYWLDQAMLEQVTNSDFLDFLLEHKNSVFILEDCEILLKSREKGGNGLINSLLNMSDGILGDSLNIKFLCTFNTNISNIDKALQRKGRLKLQYEFKPLTKDRVQKLFDTLGIEEEAKEMPLCDVYNYAVDNGVKKKETKRIGF